MEGDIVGMENECFEPNPFLISLVNATPEPNEDPLMNFVLQKDDPKLPRQPSKSDEQAMNTVTMTASPQVIHSMASQPLTSNTAAPLKKRAREPETKATRPVVSDPLKTMLLTNSDTSTPAECGEPKKAKNASEKRMELSSNNSLPLSNNFQLNVPRGKLSQNGPACSAHSLPSGANFSQIPISQSCAGPSLIGFSGVTTNTECSSIAQGNGRGFECNEEVSPLEQIPSVNPPSAASAVLSSGGFCNSPFSTSTFSEDDSLSTATPDPSHNYQENRSQFYCQASVGASGMPLEFNDLEGLGQTNGTFLNAQRLNPTLLQNKQTAPNIPAQADAQVVSGLPDVTTFVPRPNGSPQIIFASTSCAFCRIMNPKKEYDKIQKKLLSPRRSEQRIQSGKVKMKIDTKISLLDRAPVEVFVRREPTAAKKQCHEHPEQFTMDMTRIPDIKSTSNDQASDPQYPYSYKCEFDLDSVYLTADGKEVYKLVKSKGTFNNRFQLLVRLRYLNGHEELLIPYEFVLKSGRTPTHHDHYSDRSNAGFTGDAADGPRAHYVSCRHLDAETAKITNIHCENIQTENHDIAYFMRVKSNEEEVPSDMEKGDVVAFLEDDEGDTYIDFLTSENARRARLAGVISRTAFFRGRTAICDPDHLDCDLVCIIGEVEVKVVGKVQAGDLIYTSNCEQYRGSAIARNPLEPQIQDSTSENDNPTPTLLGMAMESDSDLDIKLVRCLVSIVLGISDLHQRRTLAELRECHDKITKIQKYLRGIWKKALLFLVFFLVVGILCYLFLAPNSPYLVMMCEKGCLENSKGSCQYLIFEYIHEEAQESDEIIGVLFSWKALRHKLELSFRCANHTEYRYYLNKSRCVTGGIRTISSWLDPAPRVPRVNVFAVSPNCSQVFYYSAYHRKWKQYKDERIGVKDCN